MSNTQMILETQREVARIWYLCGILLALQIAVLLLSVVKLILMDRIRANMKYSADSTKLMVELLAKAEHLHELQGREVAQANINAARLTEQAAKRLESTVRICSVETKLKPSPSDPEMPLFKAPSDPAAPALTPEQIEKVEKAKERYKRNNGGEHAPG